MTLFDFFILGYIAYSVLQAKNPSLSSQEFLEGAVMGTSGAFAGATLGKFIFGSNIVFFNERNAFFSLIGLLGIFLITVLAAKISKVRKQKESLFRSNVFMKRGGEIWTS